MYAALKEPVPSPRPNRAYEEKLRGLRKREDKEIWGNRVFQPLADHLKSQDIRVLANESGC